MRIDRDKIIESIASLVVDIVVLCFKATFLWLLWPDAMKIFGSPENATWGSYLAALVVATILAFVVWKESRK